MLVRSREHFSVIGRATRLQRVIEPIQSNGRNANEGFACQCSLQGLELGSTLLQAKMESVAMNDHIDKIGIVESNSGSFKSGGIEGPVRRPLSPEQSGDFVTKSAQRIAPPFCLKQVLVPEYSLDCRVEGLLVPLPIDNIITGIGHQAPNPFRP